MLRDSSLNKVKKINPTNLSSGDAVLLAALLKQCGASGKKIQHAGKHYYLDVLDPVHHTHRTVNIILTHDIVYRARLNPITQQLEARYSVIDTSRVMNRGKFGKIYHVIGTLMPISGDTLLLKTHKSRVMKVQHYEDERSLRKILYEGVIARMARHFHAKPVTVVEAERSTYLLMKKFAGLSLTDIIEQDKNRHHELTGNQRVQLLLKLLYALKRQIHDEHIVHRDVKPDNIMVDLVNMDVNTVDVGLSRREEDHDHEWCGTPNYASIEALNRTQEIDQLSDTGSLGIVVSLLFGADFNTDIYDDSALCQYIEGITSEEASLIKQTILRLKADDREQRISLSDAINTLHAIQLKRMLAVVPVEHCKGVSLALSSARASQDILYFKRNIQSIADVRAHFTQALSAFPDEPHAIRAFVEVLELKRFKGAESRNQIEQSLETLYLSHDAESLRLKKASAEISHMLFCANVLKSIQPYQKIYESLSLINIGLNDYIWKLDRDRLEVDKLSDLLISIEKDFNRYSLMIADATRVSSHCHSELYQIVKRLKPINSNAPLIQLKNKVREAITHYIAEETRTSSLLKEAPDDISARRRTDIQQVLSVLDECCDEGVLMNQVKVVSVNFQTGMFGNSKLRTYLQNALHHYRVEFHHRM